MEIKTNIDAMLAVHQVKPVNAHEPARPPIDVSPNSTLFINGQPQSFATIMEAAALLLKETAEPSMLKAVAKLVRLYNNRVLGRR